MRYPTLGHRYRSFWKTSPDMHYGTISMSRLSKSASDDYKWSYALLVMRDRKDDDHVHKTKTAVQRKCKIHNKHTVKNKVIPKQHRPIRQCWSSFLQSDITRPPDHVYQVVYCAVCLFTLQLSLVLAASTHGGMARLSWPGCLVTCQGGLSALRR